MAQTINLVGFDCGSTTTSAVAAHARLTTGALGRVEITDVDPYFRSDIVFTPIERGADDTSDRIDATRLAAYLDGWLAEAKLSAPSIFGGGALVTGLAARCSNVDEIVSLVESRLADAVIATADDPALEAWLAFMGNCRELSLARPDVPLLNLDIGGGTTNIALGLAGQVIATGCLYVGARHLRFEPGAYRLAGLSSFGAMLLEALGIKAPIGQVLSADDIDRIVAAWVALLVAAIGGEQEEVSLPQGLHLGRFTQLPFRASAELLGRAEITLSGGVAQLVSEQLTTSKPPNVTQFGDLGGELAARILQTPAITGRLAARKGESLGRATLFGLLRHSTELSGSTIYLPRPDVLPLKNVPIVGRLAASASDSSWTEAIALASRSRPAGALQIELGEQNLGAVRQVGERLAAELAAAPPAAGQTLVLLVPANLGKVLGGYATRWGALKGNLIVLDEVPMRDAQFVRLGRLREGVVPLSLYAIR